MNFYSAIVAFSEFSVTKFVNIPNTLHDVTLDLISKMEFSKSPPAVKRVARVKIRLFYLKENIGTLKFTKFIMTPKMIGFKDIDQIDPQLILKVDASTYESVNCQLMGSDKIIWNVKFKVLLERIPKLVKVVVHDCKREMDIGEGLLNITHFLMPSVEDKEIKVDLFRGFDQNRLHVGNVRIVGKYITKR